jgi:hypothetical protein
MEILQNVFNKENAIPLEQLTFLQQESDELEQLLH